MDKSKLIIPILSFLLLFSFIQCSKNDIDMSNIDFSNIEKLYEQPLPMIQKCVQGKWKWYVTFGGVAGISYSDNTYVDINKDHLIIEYEDGSQLKTYFSWKKYSFVDKGKGYKTWVMWDNERDQGIWYFEEIKNDTLSVGHVPSPDTTFNQFSSSFTRVK